MLEKIIEMLKEFFAGDKHLLRKLRILRYVSCIIILFIVFCESYWNLLVYIDLPCPPMLEEKYRTVLHLTGMKVFIAWIVYGALFHHMYKVINISHWMNLSYIDNLIDFCFTVYFLVYALNLGIEFANGYPIHIRTEAIVAVVYLIYCALKKSYNSHQIEYEQRRMIGYTDYCDCEGHSIPDEAKVFYRGKGYRVVSYNGIYRLLPCGEKIISSGLLKLEDAASDVEGRLILRKER